MPCYCDTPSEENQAEIERRAKVNMCRDAVSVLEKRPGCDIKIGELFEPNTLLCKLCKRLSEDEMKSISAFWYQIKWPHKTLYDWHKQHLEDDKNAA